MNEYMQYLKKALLILVSVWIVTSAVNAQEKQVVDQIVGVVASNIILKSDIESQMVQLKARGETITEKRKCELFEDLIFQKLLLYQAKLDSIEVTDKQVTSELDSRLQMFISQAGGVDELEEYFNKPLAEIREEFRTLIREQILTQQAQAGLTADVEVTPSDVQDFFRKIPKDSLKVIDDRVEYAQIVIEPAISEQEKQIIRTKLEELRQKLLNGSSFSAMAGFYSDDPGSRSKGGDLGFVSRGDLVTAFSAVAFNLEINEISQIVESEFGFHIIQVTERKGERIKVRHILKTLKPSIEAKRQASQKLDSILNIVRTDTLTFAQAARMHSDDENTRLNGGIAINRFTGNQSFSYSDIDPQTALEIKRLKVGEISNSFTGVDMKNGREVIKAVKLTSHEKPHVANLRQDYQLIKEMALADKKQQVIDQWIMEKKKEVFIKISGEYRNCKFKYDWLNIQ